MMFCWHECSEVMFMAQIHDPVGASRCRFSHKPGVMQQQPSLNTEYSVNPVLHITT